MAKYVPDANIIINGLLTRLVEGELADSEIVVANAVVAQLERQAKLGKDSGLSGLAELRRLQELAEQGKIKLSFAENVQALSK